MAKELTKEQVNRKYRGYYVEIDQRYDYQQKKWFYTVLKKHKTIKENTTLGEDVGTDMEYCR